MKNYRCRRRCRRTIRRCQIATSRLCGHTIRKESQPGGKMNQIKQAGFTFDVGPTIVMMPEIYREIFELCGVDPDDYIPMEKVDPMLQLYFADEAPLTFSMI